MGSGSEMSALLKYEPFHNLHLGDLEMLMMVVSYLSPYSIYTNERWVASNRKQLWQVMMAVLHGNINPSLAVQKCSGNAGLKVYMSKEEPSSELTEFFTDIFLRGFLKGNDYRALRMQFTFVAVFIDHATCLTEESYMKNGVQYPLIRNIVYQRKEAMREVAAHV